MAGFVKAISVRQPHASRIASGEKTVELRTWRTHHRGPLLVCSALVRGTGDGPRGVALCVVEVLGCRPATPADAAAARHEPSPGDFAWLVRVLFHVPQRPVSGRLGLFDVPAHLALPVPHDVQQPVPRSICRVGDAGDVLRDVGASRVA